MKKSVSSTRFSNKKEKRAVVSVVPSSPTRSMSASSVVTKASKMSFFDHFSTELSAQIDQRKYIKVYDDQDGTAVDVTPTPIELPRQSENFEKLYNRVTHFQSISHATRALYGQLRKSSQRLGGIKISLTDIMQGIGASRIKLETYVQEEETKEPSRVAPEEMLPFVKVILRCTDIIVLYEQNSESVAKNSEEAEEVEKENKRYDYLTIGKGKIRRRSDIETQTEDVLMKSRYVNTIRTTAESKAAYVSYFEMYDTYKALEDDETSGEISIPALITNPPQEEELLEDSEDEIEQLNRHSEKECAKIVQLLTFKHATMIISRLLASNNFESAQRRFRNMNMPGRGEMIVNYHYTLTVLFDFVPKLLDNERKAVADMSFCRANGDILAVAYGIYSFSAMHVPKYGYVCVWNIKNPNDPERVYSYHVPAITVQFSPFIPQLLAIGLYDGSVEVRDISHPDIPPVAVSQRGANSSPGCEPVVGIKWIKQTESNNTAEIDPFLALSQNCVVTRFRIINSPYLLGFKQMELERVEGMPEGLPVKHFEPLDKPRASQNPQGVNLTTHPVHKDIYYMLTDEGCLHKCSTNYQHQYLEVIRTHEGAVNIMDFSPWSPKLFLTCGNDWCIRVWMEGIFRPLITLVNRYAPVHCAYWSRKHSTIIVAINRKTVDIWDIRRNILKPMSSTNLLGAYTTLGKWSNCGSCLAIGYERGTVLMCSLDEMPYPPHFQYDELEKALFNALANFTDLNHELKSVGFFGYPYKTCIT